MTIDYDAVYSMQTIPVRSRPGSPGGHFGSADAGLICGSAHNHPGADRQRELSGTDIRTAAANSRGAPEALRGRPFLSVVATAGLRWEAGEPEHDWLEPQLDFYFVFGDNSLIRPQVSRQTELEWNVEETQRELLSAS